MPRIFRFSNLESTNETAKQPQFLDAEHGTVIIAESQSAGKGRHGKSFYSPAEHGIYMSVILRLDSPGFSDSSDFSELITMFAAVCVCQAIEALTDKKPQIKWVNDIFISGKKICGILTERRSDSLDRIIVGIGINFYFPPALPDYLPKEIQQTAGALFTGESDITPNITKNQLIDEIVRRIITHPGSAGIVKEYKQRLIAESIKDFEEHYEKNFG